MFKSEINLIKKISINNKDIWLNAAAWIGIVLLFIGFLFNRVVSNSGLLLIGVYTIIKLNHVFWLFKDKWMATFMALALIPLGSDIIMEGCDFIRFRGIMKLILILFPAFIFVWKPDQKDLNRLFGFILVIMSFSTLYSLFWYFSDIGNMAARYKISQVVPVLSYGDHIRISWATVISCLLALYMITKSTGKHSTYILAFYIVFQGIFIHILGSKTGLITLYITILIAGYFALKNRPKWIMMAMIVLVFSMPFIAYKTIPSLQQRFNFIKYDFEHYSRGEYREGLSDAVRFYSLMAGKDIILKQPIFGTGFSQLQNETNLWYKNNYPEIPKESYFLPSSEIIIYWASGGIIGLLVFLFHLFLPFTIPGLRKNIWFISFFIPAAFSFTYETHLEGQLPLFVYGFFVSIFWYLAWFENTGGRKPD